VIGCANLFIKLLRAGVVLLVVEVVLLAAAEAISASDASTVRRVPVGQEQPAAPVPRNFTAMVVAIKRARVPITLAAIRAVGPGIAVINNFDLKSAPSGAAFCFPDLF
jgi:hypothetical protein